MRIAYTLEGDEIKEAVASWLRNGHSVRLDWSDVKIEVVRDKDDRTGLETTKVTATAVTENG